MTHQYMSNINREGSFFPSIIIIIIIIDRTVLKSEFKGGERGNEALKVQDGIKPSTSANLQDSQCTNS